MRKEILILEVRERENAQKMKGSTIAQ